jgi:hypothetical protein
LSNGGITNGRERLMELHEKPVPAPLHPLEICQLSQLDYIVKSNASSYWYNQARHVFTRPVTPLLKVSSMTSGVEHITERNLKWVKLDTEFTDLRSLKLNNNSRKILKWRTLHGISTFYTYAFIII